MTIAKEFEVHLLNDSGIAKAALIANAFNVLLDELSEPLMCVEGRELSIVKTKLEEACFFAKKAMATNPVNQK